MNKPKALTALITFLILCAPACTEREPGFYERADKGFSIKFPPEWGVKEDAYGLDVVGLSPLRSAEDKFRENVSVASAKMEKPLDAQGVLEANLPSMLEMITDFKIIERGEAELGGKEAAWIEYTQRQGRRRLLVRLYAVPGKETAYLIYCTAERDTMKFFEPEFRKIAESFKAKK